MEKLILASASPRRRELLEAAGIPHTVFRMDIDETPDDAALSAEPRLPFPERYTRACALVKLRAAADMIYKGGDRPVIVAADTVVSPDGERIFGKPADADDAARMLRELSGTDHTVVGGICVTDGDETLVSSVTTHVRFKELTDREISAYVGSGEPFGKACAYAIQGKASLFVESVSGDYANIVGISVFELRRMLAELGHDPI